MMIDVEGGNAKYYYHYDALGSVVALSNVYGEIVEHYSYNVFGRPTIYDADGNEISQSEINNPYMFTGRRFDTETGLYYYRARYYSPYIGRFLQVDPIGYADSMNLYIYVGNNPVIFIDPWGLCPEKSSAKRIIGYVDFSVQGMVPIPFLANFGPWGGAGATVFIDPQAEGLLNKIGLGLHYQGGAGVGGEASGGINVGIMRGENIRSASGLGYTVGGSGAALHGAGLNIAYSDDGQTWTVDVGYNPGIAAEVHGGRIKYPIVLIPGSD